LKLRVSDSFFLKLRIVWVFLERCDGGKMRGGGCFKVGRKGVIGKRVGGGFEVGVRGGV